MRFDLLADFRITAQRFKEVVQKKYPRTRGTILYG
jgi:hypothetical protein